MLNKKKGISKVLCNAYSSDAWHEGGENLIMGFISDEKWLCSNEELQDQHSYNAIMK